VAYLPLRVMYVPKGPILDYADQTLLNQVLEWLETMARRKRALFIKVDPDVERATAEGKEARGCLRRRGWCRSEEEIQFRNTVLLDLRPSLEDLLMGMKSKWRYNVRLAKRKGVTVRQGTRDDLGLLYDMYRATADRSGFVIRPAPYYRDAWGSFMEQGLAQALIAEVEEQAVAMVIVYRFGRRAIYMYGASLGLHRDKMPNNLLQWEAMQWAKEHGCTVYDMWGAPDELDESDPMWGVYRFKKGFGGRFVEHIGAWDYSPSPLGYRLYRMAMPRILTAMRWLHWQRAGDLR
jgi:lipid II:glycine glycyltransferase (peptidoglycan interpeptide bridge formation enzyme)